ncbi:hypothetical protein D3C81_1954030 [compost metagenome]
MLVALGLVFPVAHHGQLVEDILWLTPGLKLAEETVEEELDVRHTCFGCFIERAAIFLGGFLDVGAHVDFPQALYFAADVVCIFVVCNQPANSLHHGKHRF